MSIDTSAPRPKLMDPRSASKPLKDNFTLLLVITVLRAMANVETLYELVEKRQVVVYAENKIAPGNS